jgi:CheY-like chemotaxis protein
LSDALKAFAESALKGGVANVGPLIGLDLELGEVELDAAEALPEGNFAVLPLVVEIGERKICDLLLATPLDEIATLARRMLDQEEPDKAREIGTEELDAIGEVLNLMSGGVDQAARQVAPPGVHARPLSWWRTNHPSGNKLPEGPLKLARGEIRIPSAGTVALWLHTPEELLEPMPAGKEARRQGRVVFLAMEPAMREALEKVLTDARVAIETHEPDEPHLDEALRQAEAVWLSGDRNGALDLCRRIRTDNATWEIPQIVCMTQPTRESVLIAMACGASHVLAIPAESVDVLRVLRLARETS